MSTDRTASPVPQLSTDGAQTHATLSFDRTTIGMKLQHCDSAPDLPMLGTNNSERKKRKHDCADLSIPSDIAEMFASLTRQQDKIFQELKSTINNIKEQNDDLKKSVDTLSNKYDEFMSRMSTLESQRKQDRLTISKLEKKIENLERKTRATGLEIRNIPRSNGETKESLFNTLKDLGKIVRVDLCDGDIRDVYRINSKDGSNPIIAELSSVIVKEKIINKVKSFNKSKTTTEKLNTSYLNYPGPKKPIFISETLTQNTKKLFYLARNFQKNYNYAFCWTSRGIIYIRKNEKSPQIKITTEADLEKLRISA
ncbi:unnamed protein product [Euphydryas editha]|uniref:FP protein C-terminal domain-containing protein n=1 Tax=Euphydryas editha TaxID=104508 RepID=A0AAU9TFG5_EUPED|nr:unnamed protein product [Euphydryas editha]